MADLDIVIVADDPLARAGVAALLAEHPGYRIVAQLTAAADILGALETHHPDVAIWDVGWDPRSTLDHLADLRDADLPIIVLVPDESAAASALAAGARGLLLREVDGGSLLAAVDAVSRGLLVIDPVLGSARSRVPERGVASLGEELTPRESEVLQLLAEGLSNKAIAERLQISEHTAKFHVNAILGKLDAQTRTEAVARAARLGLILL